MRSSPFLFAVTALSLSIGFGAVAQTKITDEQTIEAVAHRSAMSSTLTDFVMRLTSDPADREEILTTLQSMAVAQDRMVDLNADGAALSVDVAGITVRAEFQSKPRPQAKLWGRVIMLDRPYRDIVNDLASITKEKVYGKKALLSPFQIFTSEPRAQADGLSTAIPALGVGLRGAAKSGLGEPIKEVQADVCQNGYKFECVAKADDGKDNKIKITLPGDGFFKRYQVSGFMRKENGAIVATPDDYNLCSYPENEWDPYCTSYKVKKGSTKSHTDATAILHTIDMPAIIRGCAADKNFHAKVLALGCPKSASGSAQSPAQSGALTR